jgi:5-methylcytosine-specific restriction enzyme A
MCLATGIVTAAKYADHVVLHRGDEQLFWFGELQSLCSPCHNRVKYHIEKLGFELGCDVDGMPIDPKHPFRRGGQQ